MKKPKIGLLAMIIEGYEPIFPGILEGRTAYARELADELGAYADISFDAIATNRREIEETVRKYNAEHSSADASRLFCQNPHALVNCESNSYHNSYSEEENYVAHCGVKVFSHPFFHFSTAL